MDNRLLGILLLLISAVFGALLLVLNTALESQVESSCACGDEGFCPHEEKLTWPLYVGILLIGFTVALSAYLLFFEKSQKEIFSTLSAQKKLQTESEKFDILSKGLSKPEQKVLKAVREQDGISQNTLRLRTDLHKSKLSIVLKEMEEKGLVKKVADGRTNKIHLKIKL